MKVMIETATGLRTPSGAMASAIPALRAGLHVDRVVADAEPRDDSEPSVRVDAVLGETVAEENQRIEIPDLPGLDWVARFEICELDIRRPAQRLEVEIGIDRRAVGLAEIAGEGDPKGRAHRLRPAVLGFPAAAQPSRNLSIAPLSASCSTQTSPE